jgi:hypothetical protein
VWDDGELRPVHDELLCVFVDMRLAEVRPAEVRPPGSGGSTAEAGPMRIASPASGEASP